MDKKTAQGSDELERQYTLSISEEDREQSFRLEDERWETSKQVKDWIILVIAIVVWIAFQLSFYFLVPGIR